MHSSAYVRLLPTLCFPTRNVNVFYLQESGIIWLQNTNFGAILLEMSGAANLAHPPTHAHTHLQKKDIMAAQITSIKIESIMNYRYEKEF